MRVALTSDIHAEFHSIASTITFLKEVSVGADVLVIAGDLGVGKANSAAYTPKVVSELGAIGIPIVLTLGNHDYWHASRDQLIAAVRAACPPNVHLLQRNRVSIEGKVFAGTTLWFPWTWDAAQQENDWIDFNRIQAPFDPYSENRIDWQYLTAGPADVIVTHHLPCAEVVAPAYANSSVNCYFVGGAAHQVAEVQASVWCFGHTHTPFDGTLATGGPRLLCNPRGYPSEKNPCKAVLFEV